MKQKVAMIFGILSGMFGFLVGVFGYSLFALAGASGMPGGGLFQAISIAVPIASLVGGFIVTTNSGAAGALMFLSAAGMWWLFGMNAFTAVPLVLSVVGGCLAVDIALANKRPKHPQRSDKVELRLTEVAEPAPPHVADRDLQPPLLAASEQVVRVSRSTGPAPEAARQYALNAGRPPLDDRSFQLAKLGLAGFVALAAIAVSGALGWKYLDLLSHENKMQEEKPPIRAQEATPLPLDSSPQTEPQARTISPQTAPPPMIEARPAEAPKETQSKANEELLGKVIDLNGDSRSRLVKLQWGDLYRIRIDQKWIGVAPKSGKFSLKKPDGEGLVNCLGVHDGAKNVYFDQATYGDEFVLVACSDKATVLVEGVNQ